MWVLGERAAFHYASECDVSIYDGCEYVFILYVICSFILLEKSFRMRVESFSAFNFSNCLVYEEI